MKNFFDYSGWELHYFDEAENFRNYQLDIIKDKLMGLVAEVGPGNGSLCEKYKDYCENVVLYEPSKNLFENLTQKFELETKIKVQNSQFNSSENKFDCVLLMDVIEHVENPKNLIETLFASLKKNGKLIINVPAFQHLYSKFDEDVGHLKRYNKKNFLKEIESIKPKKIKMSYYDSVGYFLSLFAQLSFNLYKNYSYKKNFQTKISIWNFLIPISRILDKILLNSFGKSLFIVITK